MSTAKRRMRFGSQLPPLPDKVELPYSLNRPEFAGLSNGQLAQLILQSQAWQKVMVPILDALERTRPKKGPKPLYSSHELEAVLLYQRLCGLDTYKRARERLAGDQSRDRQALGLDKPRNRQWTVVNLRDGIPSESTVARHCHRFGERRRLWAYQLLKRELLKEHLTSPQMQEEVRLLHLDGTALETRFTCPKREKATTKDGRQRKQRKIVNKTRVTCPEGGYMPWSAGPGKAGQGFNLISLTTTTGLPLLSTVVPLHVDEGQAALDMLQRNWANQIERYLLPQRKLGVVSADRAYHRARLREELHALGLLPNVHDASHGNQPKTNNYAAKKDRARLKIDGYPNWRANGHRELNCRCGQGQTWKRIECRRGRAVARVEGRCPTCGPITITAGDWRSTQDQKAKQVNRKGRLVRVDHNNGKERDKIDWLFGNPLTYHDPVSNAYGISRFAHNEGFFGSMATRFGVNRRKRWYRRLATAQLDCEMTFCIMHALALEQRQRAEAARAAQATGPPQLAA